MSKPEAVAANTIQCNGRERTFESHPTTYAPKAALATPIDALITSFSDGTREICCRFFDGRNESCAAGNGSAKSVCTFASTVAKEKEMAENKRLASATYEKRGGGHH